MQYKANSEAENDAVWRNASNVAKRKLQKAQRYSGTAILGRASEALKYDPKFQGEYREVSVAEGQKIAHASLASEVFICNLAGIDPLERYKCTGRSQYPKFIRRPVTCKSTKDSKYHSSDYQKNVRVLPGFP